MKRFLIIGFLGLMSLGAVQAAPAKVKVASHLVLAESVDLFPGFLAGLEFQELSESLDFKVVRKSEIAVKGPILSYQDRKRKYRVSKIVHLPTRAVLTSFTTFQDQDDGGNTLGWIQNARAQVVALINDGSMMPTTAPLPEFLVGKEIFEILNSIDFVLVSESKLMARGPRAEYQDRDREYLVKLFQDKSSGQYFKLHYTNDDQYDGGNSLGWIENLANQVVGKIDDSTFYRVP